MRAAVLRALHAAPEGLSSHQLADQVGALVAEGDSGEAADVIARALEALEGGWEIYRNGDVYKNL